MATPKPSAKEVAEQHLNHSQKYNAEQLKKNKK